MVRKLFAKLQLHYFNGRSYVKIDSTFGGCHQMEEEIAYLHINRPYLNSQILM